MIQRTQILDAQVEFLHQKLARPLQLSSGVISELSEARAQVRVSVDGQEAVGRGSIYLSDLWAWPHAQLSHEYRDAALRKYSQAIAASLRSRCGNQQHHPLELGLRLHESVCHDNSEPPMLARAMCASPFDAAIHDAAGIAIEKSAFAFYEAGSPIPAADKFFGTEGACRAIRRMLRPPVAELNAWWVIGASDALGADSDLAGAIRRYEYRCFKMKTLGVDANADAQRTRDVFNAVKKLGLASPRISADSNEANPDAASVKMYLEALRAIEPAAFASLEYLEQPTGRDIRVHPNDWRAVAALKPVFLDEGLTDFDVLPDAVAQRWSGLAIKTCKGHSFCLASAAWAHQRGMMLAMQDLTNSGFGAIHSALMAAHLPSINGVELNSLQFTPAANREWLPRLSPLFEPANGVHRLDGLLRYPGLASMA